MKFAYGPSLFEQWVGCQVNIAGIRVIKYVRVNAQAKPTLLSAPSPLYAATQQMIT